MKDLWILPMIALLPTPILAQGLANTDEITAAITGNTVQGGMSDGAVYSEFYDTDGSIKADGYTGTWAVANDEMCFDYGEGASCFSLDIMGDQVTWIQEGAEAGTGTIVAGNPNGY